MWTLVIVCAAVALAAGISIGLVAGIGVGFWLSERRARKFFESTSTADDASVPIWCAYHQEARTGLLTIKAPNLAP